MWSASVIYPWASLVSYFFDDIASAPRLYHLLSYFEKIAHMSVI